MKKKLNSGFLALVAVAIVITLVLTTTVYYKTFQKEIMEDLRSYTYILEASGIFENGKEPNVDLDIDTVRVTVIENDGNVTYDSDANIGEMDNHRSRPEVVDAFNNGEGEDIRKSSTLSKNTFYYAIKMENGSVLRIAKETGSIWSIFTRSFPLIGIVSVLLFVVCIFMANFLTKIILKPIKEISKDLDNMENVSTYKEIMPFIKVIHSQHEDILKSAKIRQEFTANVSHELKTPLTSISGYSELIENGMAAEGDVIRFAREIHSSSQRLLSLINDIIKLSELDSNDMEIELENVDLYEVANECKNMLEFHADENQVKIYLDGVSASVNASKRMIEEVIYNLCDNAIRYNHPGGHVWVTVNDSEDRAEVIVKDDGIGIAEKDRQRIFERFYRVDKSRSKKTGGTGLGLAIVKHIVEQHGAEVFLESEEGKGTEIKVVFEK